MQKDSENIISTVSQCSFCQRTTNATYLTSARGCGDTLYMEMICCWTEIKILERIALTKWASFGASLLQGIITLALAVSSESRETIV